jgi:hypothetical protein
MQYGLSAESARGAVFLTILLGIAITDARFYIIPDQFSLGGGLLGLALDPGGSPGRRGRVWCSLVGCESWNQALQEGSHGRR